MIPYLQIPPLELGPLSLHAFGALSALGVVVGAHLARRGVHTAGNGDEATLVDALPWALGGGLVGAHLAHVLAYHPELLTTQGPWVLLRIWDGISSMGGLLGGLLALWIVLRRKGARLSDYTDALALGVAPGWAIARVGCFLAHDHPGVRTDFPLAVAYPGGARHDLGLYEAVLLGALTVVLYVLARRRPARGVLTGVLALGYGAARFFLDFLRATDLPGSDGRIFGLTFAQYTAVGLVGVGVWLLAGARRREGPGDTETADADPQRAAA